MTQRRTLIGLSFILVLAVIFVIIDRKRSESHDELLELGDVSQVEILFQGKKVLLKKTDSQWQIERFDEVPVQDTRANHDLVTHIVDIVGVVKKADHNHIDPALAPEYGMSNPELALTMSWQKPTAGQDVVIFGHKELSEYRVFAFFPKQPLLAPVSSNTLKLLEGKTALDLRDRRITTFEADDIDDLIISGRKCRALTFTRDGDRWLKPASFKSDSDVDAWIETFTSLKYEEIEENLVENPSISPENSICVITLKGRKGRMEIISVYPKTKNSFWVKNSALPARYRLSSSTLDHLRINQ